MAMLTATEDRAGTKLDRTAPRVLMVSNFLAPKHGSRAVQQDIRERLEAQGYSITAASSYRSGLARGSHMVLAALTRRGSYDIALVDVYSNRAFRWAEAVSRTLVLLKKPFVFVLHGGNLPHFAARAPERVSRCLNRAAAVVAPSRYLQEQMRPYHAGIGLIPNGVNLGRYSFRQRRECAPRLMWLRALHHTYNPAMAVRVVAGLATQFPDAHVTLVGPDKMDGAETEVRRLADELGVSGRVSLPGAVEKDDVPLWMAKGDIFLNTTNTDNTPVSVLEAMACGLPVVSTNAGGLPYLLEDGHDALLVPSGDDRGMAEAVRRLLMDPELAARLSTNAREKVEGFDWSAVIPQWKQVLGNAWESARL